MAPIDILYGRQAVHEKRVGVPAAKGPQCREQHVVLVEPSRLRSSPGLVCTDRSQLVQLDRRRHERGDLFNFGSVGVAGNDIVTQAVGLKHKRNSHRKLGSAY